MAALKPRAAIIIFEDYAEYNSSIKKLLYFCNRMEKSIQRHLK